MLTGILLWVFSIFGHGKPLFIFWFIPSQAYHKIINVEEKLSRGWGGENAYHVSGYRYLIVDGDRHISRASPPGKVTTLAKVCIFNNYTFVGYKYFL